MKLFVWNSLSLSRFVFIFFALLSFFFVVVVATLTLSLGSEVDENFSEKRILLFNSNLCLLWVFWRKQRKLFAESGENWVCDILSSCDDLNSTEIHRENFVIQHRTEKYRENFQIDIIVESSVSSLLGRRLQFDPFFLFFGVCLSNRVEKIGDIKNHDDEWVVLIQSATTTVWWWQQWELSSLMNQKFSIQHSKNCASHLWFAWIFIFLLICWDEEKWDDIQRQK